MGVGPWWLWVASGVRKPELALGNKCYYSKVSGLAKLGTLKCSYLSYHRVFARHQEVNQRRRVDRHVGKLELLLAAPGLRKAKQCLVWNLPTSTIQFEC